MFCSCVPYLKIRNSRKYKKNIKSFIKGINIVLSPPCSEYEQIKPVPVLPAIFWVKSCSSVLILFSETMHVLCGAPKKYRINLAKKLQNAEV